MVITSTPLRQWNAQVHTLQLDTNHDVVVNSVSLFFLQFTSGDHGTLFTTHEVVITSLRAHWNAALGLRG